jgi:hypothetical protein
MNITPVNAEPGGRVVSLLRHSGMKLEALP